MLMLSRTSEKIGSLVPGLDKMNFKLETSMIGYSTPDFPTYKKRQEMKEVMNKL